MTRLSLVKFSKHFQGHITLRMSTKGSRALNAQNEHLLPSKEREDRPRPPLVPLCLMAGGPTAFRADNHLLIPVQTWVRLREAKGLVQKQPEPSLNPSITSLHHSCLAERNECILRNTRHPSLSRKIQSTESNSSTSWSEGKNLR